MTLSKTDQATIRRARELAVASGVDELRAWTGRDADTIAVLTSALGSAQFLLLELAAIAERAAGG
jgi:hypothetical protein